MRGQRANFVAGLLGCNNVVNQKAHIHATVVRTERTDACGDKGYATAPDLQSQAGPAITVQNPMLLQNAFLTSNGRGAIEQLSYR